MVSYPKSVIILNRIIPFLDPIFSPNEYLSYSVMQLFLFVILFTAKIFTAKSCLFMLSKGGRKIDDRALSNILLLKE